MIRVKKTLALFLTEISAGVVYHNEIQNFVTEHKMITLLSALNFATLGAALKYSFGNGYGVREGGLLGAGALVVVGPAKDFLNAEKKITYVNDLEEHVSDMTPLENMEKYKAIYLIASCIFMVTVAGSATSGPIGGIAAVGMSLELCSLTPLLIYKNSDGGTGDKNPKKEILVDYTESSCYVDNPVTENYCKAIPDEATPELVGVANMDQTA